VLTLLGKLSDPFISTQVRRSMRPVGSRPDSRPRPSSGDNTRSPKTSASFSTPSQWCDRREFRIAYSFLTYTDAAHLTP
jgi:hypothetical protein